MKVRLKDVAQRAGVAVNTASMILNKRPNCWASKQTGERVFQAAAELHYKPSRTAVALRLGKFHTVGLLVPDLENPFWAHLTQLLELEMQKHGYDLMIESSHSSPERELNCMESILERQIDGLITCFMGHDENLQSLEVHARSGKPVLALTADGNVPVSIDSIVFNRKAGITDALNHLAALGHTRATILQPSEDIFSNALMDLSCLKCDSTLKGTFDTASELLSGSERPTAILVSNDLCALGVMKAAFEQGLDLPSELSIISLENSPIGEFLPMPLTSIQQPIEEIVRLTSTLMLTRLKEKAKGAVEHHKLASGLLVRKSTAPPAPIHPEFKTSFEDPQTAFVQSA